MAMKNKTFTEALDLLTKTSYHKGIKREVWDTNYLYLVYVEYTGQMIFELHGGVYRPLLNDILATDWEII